MKFVPTRQVHLDFHTSEYIPAVAENFSAEEFAQTIADAHINSVTVFARCITAGCIMIPKNFLNAYILH